jgi:hypothetical protein
MPRLERSSALSLGRHAAECKRMFMRRSGRPLFRGAVHQAEQALAGRNVLRGSHINSRRMTPHSTPSGNRSKSIAPSRPTSFRTTLFYCGIYAVSSS